MIEEKGARVRRCGGVSKGKPRSGLSKPPPNHSVWGTKAAIRTGPRVIATRQVARGKAKLRALNAIKLVAEGKRRYMGLSGAGALTPGHDFCSDVAFRSNYRPASQGVFLTLFPPLSDAGTPPRPLPSFITDNGSEFDGKFKGVAGFWIGTLPPTPSLSKRKMPFLKGFCRILQEMLIDVHLDLLCSEMDSKEWKPVDFLVLEGTGLPNHALKLNVQSPLPGCTTLCQRVMDDHRILPASVLSFCLVVWS